MSALYEFLEEIKRSGGAAGNFLGLLHVLIGRRLARQDGTVISVGLTWREVAVALKKVRWEKNAVSELALAPAALPPRDRERYWYAAIARAQVDSLRAAEAGNRLATTLQSAGYVVSTTPRPENSKSPV
jgi:hypothetical protein